MQKRKVVVAHVGLARVRRGAGAEKAVAELTRVEDLRLAQARFSADECVKEPAGVWEVRVHSRVSGAEEVEEDQVLDRRERSRWRRG
jgi:hypothetical protein